MKGVMRGNGIDDAAGEPAVLGRDVTRQNSGLFDRVLEERVGPLLLDRGCGGLAFEEGVGLGCGLGLRPRLGQLLGFLDESDIRVHAGIIVAIGAAWFTHWLLFKSRDRYAGPPRDSALGLDLAEALLAESGPSAADHRFM